jgi:undecaprenyl-diphosphatase
MLDWVMELDTRLFLFLNGLHSEGLDGVMYWISGKTTWWPFYVLLLAYLAWQKGWQLAPMVLFIALSITLTDQTSVHLFKEVFERLRPCRDPALEEVIHLVNGRCAGGKFGFISSHAANTFGVASLLLYWIRRPWFTVVMIIWGTLVAYSRIYLGAHYPGDVLAGSIWGLLCGWLVYRVFILLMKHVPAHWWITRTPGVRKF